MVKDIRMRKKLANALVKEKFRREAFHTKIEDMIRTLFKGEDATYLTEAADLYLSTSMGPNFWHLQTQPEGEE